MNSEARLFLIRHGAIVAFLGSLILWTITINVVYGRTVGESRHADILNFHRP